MAGKQIVINCFILLLAQSGCFCTSLKYRQTCDHSDGNVLHCIGISHDIPPGIRHVIITNWMNPGATYITASTFSYDPNWQNVNILEMDDDSENGNLVIAANAFEGLKNLTELHIHIVRHITINNIAFEGSDNLKELDFNDCHRLRLPDLLPALNETYTMPNLKKLMLSSISTISVELLLDDNSLRIICARNLTHIDLSYTRMLHFNLTSVGAYCTSLEYLNITMATFLIVDFGSNHYIKPLKQLK